MSPLIVDNLLKGFLLKVMDIFFTNMVMILSKLRARILVTDKHIVRHTEVIIILPPKTMFFAVDIIMHSAFILRYIYALSSHR